MDYIEDLIKRYPILQVCEQDIRTAFELIVASYKNSGKLLIAGNGGSAADSDHISGELLKSFVKKRKSSSDFLSKLKDIDWETGTYLSDKMQDALPAIALTNNSAVMTASLNDIDGNVMFAQQVNGLGNPNDIFLGISTSGNSKNIISAMVTAKAKGLRTIALTGKDGGKLKSIADVSIVAPEKETYKIQELHLPIYHALCLQLEEYFFEE